MTKIYLLLFLIFVLELNSFAQEIYKNDKYSFSVQGPKDWHVLNHKDLKGRLDHTHAVQNLITYYKYTEDIYGQINPTINIQVVPNKFKTIEEFNKKMSRRRYQKNLINYSLKSKPQLLTIGGKYGVFEKSTYIVDNKQNGERNVKRMLYAFPTTSFIYYVSLIDERESEENTALFKEVVMSIKIDPSKS